MSATILGPIENIALSEYTLVQATAFTTLKVR